MSRLITNGNLTPSLRVFRPKYPFISNQLAYPTQNSFTADSYSSPHGFLFPDWVDLTCLEYTEDSRVFLNDLNLYDKIVGIHGGIPREPIAYHYWLTIMKYLAFPQLLGYKRLYSEGSTQYRLLEGFATHFTKELAPDSKSLIYQATGLPSLEQAKTITVFNQLQDFPNYLAYCVEREIPFSLLVRLTRIMFGSK